MSSQFHNPVWNTGFIMVKSKKTVRQNTIYVNKVLNGSIENRLYEFREFNNLY